MESAKSPREGDVSTTETGKEEETREQYQRWKKWFFDLFAEFGMREGAIEYPTFEDAEVEEIIEKSNKMASKINVIVSRERWLSLINITRHLICAKHMKCRRTFVGATILDNIAFFWDDVDISLLDNAHMSLVLESIREVCREYYKEEVQEFVYFHVHQWMCLDSYSRRNPHIRENICSIDLNVYWDFRVVDSATPFWYGVTAPLYEDEELTMMLFFLAQMSMKLFIVVNDVYSYPKEKIMGEPSNFLYHAEGLSLHEQDAMVRRELNAMRLNLETLCLFGEVSKDVIMHTTFGQLLWSESKMNPRYHQSDIDKVHALNDYFVSFKNLTLA